MTTQIDSEVVNVCNTTKACESSNCVHCHLISSTDVSTAVSKRKPVYVLLLYVSKALDKVAFNVLFNKLRDRSMCPHITKLLHHMYTVQSCYVKWGNEHSDSFNVSNGVKQGGVITPLLFSC